MNDVELAALLWPVERLGEALEELARRAKLRPAGGDEALVPPRSVCEGNVEDLQRWTDWAGTRLGLEVESVDTTLPDFEQFLRRAAPALMHLRLPGGAVGHVLLLGRRGTQLRLIGPDLREHHCPIETLRAAKCAPFEAAPGAEVERLLAAAGVPAGRRSRARRVMLADRLRTERMPGCWILRQPVRAGLRAQLAQLHVPRRVLGMLVLFAALYGLEIEAWRLVGAAALDGRLDLGWLAAWLLMLLTLVPLRLLSGWLNAGVALDVARLLKQRLLVGGLRIDIDLLRHQGAGSLLGRVIESQALESLVLDGGLAVLVGLIEIGFALWILSQGATGGWHVVALLGWLVVTLAATFNFQHRLRRWTLQRLRMTQDMVECMVGHRTRLAQDQPARRDAEEDRGTQDYLLASRAMDRAVAPIVALAPGGWILLGLAVLAPAFVSGTASAAGLAISLGGILFAHRALAGMSGGLNSLGRAAIAWQQVAPIFHAGARHEDTPRFVEAQQLAQGEDSPVAPPLVDASHLAFRYRGDGEAVLDGVELALRRGERVLLEGPSGGGKSTLAALLVGLRQPTGGLLLMNGLDRPTLGEAWHRLATEAPQFHENHVLAGSLAFNLLMGRQGDTGPEALAEAEALCRELGLGELIDRMPAGLQQRIGETGWQLSHGEKSRVFLARALLQRAPLTVLDESFAALDPPTLRLCLETALRRARALVVIAHP